MWIEYLGMVGKTLGEDDAFVELFECDPQMVELRRGSKADWEL